MGDHDAAAHRWPLRDRDTPAAAPGANQFRCGAIRAKSVAGRKGECCIVDALLRTGLVRNTRRLRCSRYRDAFSSERATRLTAPWVRCDSTIARLNSPSGRQPRNSVAPARKADAYRKMSNSVLHYWPERSIFLHVDFEYHLP
uniref:Chlorocatechol 1,2-dioxygenase n=1 Tax=Pseudomonas putida TaxID=303 RepID=Q706T5_PSEPU|nr:chlorocatechol 1,2-dioxygenase [Pseudomonas putida]